VQTLVSNHRWDTAATSRRFTRAEGRTILAQQVER